MFYSSISGIYTNLFHCEHILHLTIGVYFVNKISKFYNNDRNNIKRRTLDDDTHNQDREQVGFAYLFYTIPKIKFNVFYV